MAEPRKAERAKLKMCESDVKFEARMRLLASYLHSEVGYKAAWGYAEGDFPVDWSAVRSHADDMHALADEALKHRESCELCRKNDKDGYEVSPEAEKVLP